MVSLSVKPGEFQCFPSDRDSIFMYRVDHGSPNNFMAKGHARYCGLVRGPHVEK